MAMAPPPQPTRGEVDALPGPVVVEFGLAWCEFSKALRSRMVPLLAEFPAVTHVRVDDTPGAPLGQSFGVSTWPTVVFLRDGRVVRTAVRPWDDEIRQGLEEVSR